jgi:hypothetical protein
VATDPLTGIEEGGTAGCHRRHRSRVSVRAHCAHVNEEASLHLPVSNPLVPRYTCSTAVVEQDRDHDLIVHQLAERRRPFAPAASASCAGSRSRFHTVLMAARAAGCAIAVPIRPVPAIPIFMWISYAASAVWFRDVGP